MDRPVLHKEEAADDEADVGDVVGVVPPDELHDDDGHVAEEVSQADRADGPRHAMIARRELAVHVVTGVGGSFLLENPAPSLSSSFAPTCRPS